MVKLRWWWRSEPDALWSHVLRFKYCKSVDILPRSIGSNSSNAWKEIMTNKNILHASIGKAIGDGTSTFFWLDSWEESRPLSEVITSPTLPKELEFKVAEYWDRRRGWRWDALRNHLPMETLEKIASFELHEESTKDRIFWKVESAGTFSLKSAIALIRHDPKPQPTDSWKWAWRLSVPQ